MQRSTVRLDDDLMFALKERAHREATSVTKLINQAIRDWLAGRTTGPARRTPYVQKTFSMGEPLVDLNKALQFSGELEDEAIIERLRRGT
ncbi:MAG: ribbon-helix-helix protein, CopG family [Pirellulales bacterium]|nr:ribbon-helix-helix protein, CopG family [Pirellulales bacterium]